MAEIELNPTEQIIKDSVEESTCTDGNGRVIKLKKPGALAQFRLVAALGDELSSNRTYMSMVLPLIYVAAIDGDNVSQPKNLLQIEALIQRLDETGLTCVMEAVNKAYGDTDPEADKEALKK